MEYSRFGWKLRRVALQVMLHRRNINFENFFQNDNVAVYPQLGVIFNRIKKSGNTSVVAFLDDLERNKTGAVREGNNAEEIKSSRRPHVMPISAVFEIRNYSTLTVVRNPYHRAISGFLEKIAKGTNPRYSNLPSYGDSSIEAFERFLDACKSEHFFGNRHFYPQVSLLFQPVDKFTGVARLESIVQDMGAFLAKIGIDSQFASVLEKPHQIEQLQSSKIQNASKKDRYLTPRTRRMIEELYKDDFETFGYDHIRE